MTPNAHISYPIEIRLFSSKASGGRYLNVPALRTSPPQNVLEIPKSIIATFVFSSSRKTILFVFKSR